MQTKILPTHMDRIDTINGHDQETPGSKQCNLKTVINNENIQLLVYLVDMYPDRFSLEYNGYQTN